MRQKILRAAAGTVLAAAVVGQASARVWKVRCVWSL